MSEQRIAQVGGTAVPIPGDDVDTDQILPARFLKEVTFERMNEYLFYDARRDEDGTLGAHPIDSYEGASIAVVNSNFGCGSSREHAPQAMMRWGIDGIVGESYAEIFRDNCKSLGIPAVTTDHEAVEALQRWIEQHPTGEVHIDVREATVEYGETTLDVEIDHAMREALLDGIWDTTQLMYSNLSKVERTATNLPYVGGFDSAD
jgi:3-isopropylmalate/(R)-2-methylmalate dehydratase small subunit